MLSSNLPSQLQERVLVLNDGRTQQQGEFVLYWAHHALRVNHNPALETAASLALQLGLPLLVYQGLGGRHRYNSDRHHRFILEAARDFGQQLSDVGLRLFFHLPEDPLAPGPLPGLLQRCAAVVSELFPVPPFRQWYQQHVRSFPGLPFLLVDASCILPMTLSERAPGRAFQFRNRYHDEISQRVASGWVDHTSWPAPFSGDPGFVPFDLASNLSEAIAGCRIDHSIPAVVDTRGGTKEGYRRWAQFLQNGLNRYHQLRNDATQPEGVSRLSAYLHYGCVSPFRIAQEAVAQGGEGAEKFLDELLTWRELSHHFCHHTEALETLEAIPGWARESLAAQQSVPRDATYDWEKLSRGKSGNPLWDLAQRSLLRRGELHNNVRMTWGKAFLPWVQTTSRALKLMIDLNHRFALDGNDPNSYGGILWCLGQFDRAFPAGPVFGKVRQRSIARHASRLDLSRYAALVSKPAGGTSLRVGVIGAGLAGLTAAGILEDQGHSVVVLEKSRGAGGRMSTRRDGDHRFDHGAQYFTARDPRFRRHVYAWRERGLVEQWSPRLAVISEHCLEPERTPAERFVAVPGMSSICSDLAADLQDCRFNQRVISARHDANRWLLDFDGPAELDVDALLLAIPPEQASHLLGDAQVRQALDGVHMLPCWSVMGVLDRPLLQEHDAAFVNAGPLSWVARQNSRPGRPGAESWVLHASPQWSVEHLEANAEDVLRSLLEAARALPQAQPFEEVSAIAHRWRYALAAEPLDSGALWFEKKRLVLAGDWCNGSRIEGAFLSGVAAAGRIMAACTEAS